ncbi:MAG: hypothetical protein RIA69_19380 [Cyclobacteriaceae bacterium]
MKNNYTLTDAMIPGTQGKFQWDLESRCIKDIKLKNTFATEFKVSEMMLNLRQITAIDTQGNEVQIKSFEHETLAVEEISTQKHLKTGILRHLKPGEYQTVRFYIEPKGNFFTTNTEKDEVLPEMEFLEFEIVEGLTIHRGELPNLLFRFDLTPKKEEAKVNRLAEIFRKSLNVGEIFEKKLAESFR